MIYRLLLILNPSHYYLDPFNQPFDLIGGRPFHPETTILLANHQMHIEASEVLYGELALIVLPEEIAVLRSMRNELTPDIIRPSTSSYGIWKNNPLSESRPLQYRRSNGLLVRTHKSRRFRGKMYPHVFSRFRNIIFQMSFNHMYFPDPVFTGRHASFPVDLDYSIAPPYLDAFAKHISSTKIIRDFVTVISQASLISTLWITLDIEVLVEPARSACRPVEFPVKAREVANKKAVEIWLECGVLDPLKKLKNVKYAIVNVMDFGSRPGSNSFAVLEQKYAEIVEKLEEDIALAAFFGQL